MVTRPPAGSIPDAPGSYQFKDRDGRVIYVGKAKSLRSRLSNYFQNPRNLLPRTAQMVAAAETVEWIEVKTEVDALMLEYNLIQRHRPRFNVRLRDDKSYPFMAITMSDEWPRAMVRRGVKDKGMRYFGPYGHAYAIRETLDLLLRTFPIRTCSDNKFHIHQRQGRPCLLFHIEKCSGPCVKEIDHLPYYELVQELVDFLDGETQPIVKRLESEMRAASDTLEFERAARLRDRLITVRKVIERQQMVADKSEDIDVVGIAEDELEASVQGFYVRKGRVVGRKGFIVDKVEDLTPPQLMADIVEQLYGESPLGIPATVLVPELPEDAEFLEEFLTLLREERAEAGAGKNEDAERGDHFTAGAPGTELATGTGRRARGSRAKVQIRVPQRGEKRTLLETVTRNAGEEFTRHRLRRASDHNTRSRALTELQRYLELPEAPLRIECYDMAHLQGTDYVGSMVVLEDGLPNKREYRKFKVHVPGNDDYAAMEEVLTRRLKAYIDERDRLIGERGDKPGRFAYPPQLLLVDGGKGQLGVAQRVVETLGLADEIPIASLAKRYEEVYVPGRPEPVEVPRGSEALFMLQRVRDEAHRFANTFHGQRRSKRMVASSLDGIAGLGEARKKQLVKAMGGVNAVKKASLEELQALSFLPDAVAQAVYDRYHA